MTFAQLMAYAAEAEVVRAEEQLGRIRASDMPHLGRRDRVREFRRLAGLLSGGGTAAERQARWNAGWARGRQWGGGAVADPRMAKILKPGERVVAPEGGG